ncbi:MAG TPA: hypothetical protein VJG13_13860 [Thermoanaerobaculia bacterium]|nr:hypothetical protein [Thermoanaerobaculia bacterium]
MRTNVKSHFSPGWDERLVRQMLKHYENQSEEEAVAEDEAAFETSVGTLTAIPPGASCPRER